MQILLSWLRDFVEISESPEDVAESLTMAGMAVDAVTHEDGETIFELDITANRPDAMNHFGIARELSAIYNRPLQPPAVDVQEDKEPASGRASIEIADPELCPRYSGRVFEGIEVKPSPEWLSRRLELCGVRSVNNIADLTNYVLLEIGHPTHAFDLDLLDQSKIIVRRAENGELLRTLDGMDRTLSSDHLVIADASRAVALAGVMGGLETEISNSTRNVLLEAAWFLPGSIRRTARQFGMHTEASHRFERGADIEATQWAADRIAHLLPQISPGSVLAGVIDTYPKAAERQEIPLRPARIRQLLGVEISGDEMERILQALGFAFETGENGWRVTPPSFRLDVEREIDLIEEIARIWGYHRFPMTLPPSVSAVEDPPHAKEESHVLSVLRSLGYDETVSYAFISEQEAKQFGSENAVMIRNPVSDHWTVMRNTAVPSVLRALEWNLNRNESDVRLMEIGRVYRKNGDPYHEPPVLVLGATGMARPAWLGEAGKPFDFYELKGDVSKLLSGFNIEEPAFESRDLPPHYLAGQAARIVAEGKNLGYLGEIDLQFVQSRKMRQPVFIAEIFLESLWAFGLKALRYRPLPRVPPVYRDFSLLVPEGISFSEISLAVGAMEHLVRLEPVEFFAGEQVPEGFYSLLLRAVWQKMDESLTDEEVNQYAHQIVGSLSKTLGVQQRS